MTESETYRLVDGVISYTVDMIGFIDCRDAENVRYWGLNLIVNAPAGPRRFVASIAAT
jgi:hypothetical protein